MTTLNRRRFLCAVTGTGAALAGGAWWFGRSRGDAPRGAGAINGPAPLMLAERSSYALGADVTMQALHANRDQAQRAIDAAFDELELVEQVMSLYRPESELCRLNREGVLSDPHPYLVEVLRLATDLSRRTAGAFDVTVQPLWRLHATAGRENRSPTGAQIEAARKKIDWRRVEISNEQIRLRGEGTEITLNGVAQGFAADRAMEALRRHGVRHALVDTGEIGSLGEKFSGKPWKVGVQHPRQPDAFLALAKLKGRCLATSGDYETRFGDDYLRHHLFDPRTGDSAGQLSSVSVAAGTAVEADALSTAIFVLGLRRGFELVQATPGADALLVDKRGAVKATAGFPLDS